VKTLIGVQTLADVLEAVTFHNEGAPFPESLLHPRRIRRLALPPDDSWSHQLSMSPGIQPKATISLPFLFAGAVPGVVARFADGRFD